MGSELGSALQVGVERGELRPDVDCAAVATEVFAMMDGLQVPWLHDPDPALTLTLPAPGRS